MALKVWMFLLAMTLPDISSKIVNETSGLAEVKTMTGLSIVTI